MGMNARQVRGDDRTGELASRNEKEIQFVPSEITRFAEHNIIHIFNVAPWRHIIQHPMLGKFTIPACEPGQRYSKPAVLKGMVPYGVCVEMKTVEIRHDSGRFVATDVLGIGPFRRPEDNLTRLGVFIAAEDTFDAKDVASVQVANGRDGKPIFMALPRWVESGKLGSKPTEKELTRAEEAFAAEDFRLIAEADGFWNEGPKGQENIVRPHREALRRRNQLREWDKPLQSLIDCPGCGSKIAPTVVVHSCGAVFNWDKAIELGIKKESDRPETKPKAKA